MSRRHRSHGQRRSLALPIILFGGVLLLVAVVLFATRSAGGGSGSAGGTPQIVVDQPKIDYGYVKYGNDKQFTIKVTNSGSGVLRFKTKPYIEVLEGC